MGVCCYLQTSNSFANMLVMELVLGPSWSIMGILLYAKVSSHTYILMAQYALMCSNMCKQFALCANNNKPHNTLLENKFFELKSEQYRDGRKIAISCHKISKHRIYKFVKNSK